MWKINQYGQALIEIMLALGIFALFGVGAATLVLTGLTDTQGGEEQTQASFYAQEGIDAARSIRDNHWRNLVNGDHGVDDAGGEWVFSGTSDTIDTTFTRVVNVDDVSRDVSGDIVTSGGTVDPRTKLVTSTITWNDGLIPRTVQHQVYLTDWNKYDWTETFDTEFNLGTLTQTEVDGSGLAASVILEEGTGGGPGEPTGPAEWVEGGGALFVDTTDANFDAGTFVDMRRIDSDTDAYLELDVEPKWDIFDFPFGTTDMNYASEYFAVGNNGNAYRWQANKWAEIDTPTTEDLNHVTDVSNNEAYAVGDNGYAMRYFSGVWTTVTTPTGQDINGVDMVSTDDGWAVADNGITLRWNGSEWVNVTNPTSRDLQSVYVVASDDVWAVGFQGTILHWDGASWTSITSPSNKELYSVWMISASDGFAVGNNGEILRYNGSSWALFTSPTTRRLQSISMISATDGFIVGDAGEIVRWNGTNWNVVLSPANDDLMSVYMIDSSDGWVVGDNGNVYRWNGSEWTYYTQTGTDDARGIDIFNASFGITTGNNGFVTHFDGNVWTPFDSGTGQDLDDVSIISATDAFAVGEGGTIRRWNGTTWSGVSSPTGQQLNGVEMLGASDGWAVGNNGTILRWSGVAWATVSSPTGNDLEGISMLSATDGFISGENGTILRWNGSSWSTMTSGTGNDLYAISMLSGTQGMAVGQNGEIREWNGTTWSNNTSPYGGILRGVHLYDATIGYAVGNSGNVIEWNGSSWSSVSTPTGQRLNAIDMISATGAWIPGENGAVLQLAEFYKTSGTFESRVFDGGAVSTAWDFIQWSERNFTVTNITIATRTGETAIPDGSWSGWSSELTDPNGVAILSPNARYIQYRVSASTSNFVISPELLDIKLITNDPGLAQDLNEVELISDTDGWGVADSGVIVRYNGTNWQNVTSPTGSALNGLDMVSATDGWAVGSGGTIIRWNGSSWSTVTSPTSNALYGVSMISASDGFAVGASGEIIRWNGTVWSLQSSPSASQLNAIKMVDGSNGWIVGNGGTILSWNGTTWSTVASPVGESLNGVDFISTTDGWAVGASGKILRYDGSWSEFADSGSTTFNDIWMFDTNTGVMVGSGGKILRWDTVAWILDYSPTSEQINAVSLIDEDEAWAVGNNGLFLHYIGIGGASGGGPVAAQIIDDTQSEFDTGTYTSTQWNIDHVELNAATSGTYESEVFDGTDTGVSWDQLAWVEDISATGLSMEVGSETWVGGFAGGPGQIDDDTQGEFDTGTYSDTQWATDHVELDSTGLSNGVGTYTSEVFNTNGTTTFETITWVPDAPYGKELPDSTPGVTDWWDSDYQNRRKITFGTAHSALDANHTVTLVMDTQAGSTNVALTSGNDVRIVWQPTVGADTELDRIGNTWNNASTSIDFRLQSAISANADEDADGSYYVYYNFAGAGSPPADEANVYFFADYFNRANSSTIGNGWTEWNNGGGDADIASNTLTMQGNNAGPPDAGIKQTFPLGAIPDDFIIEWDWTMPSNSEGLWTHYVNIGDSGTMVDSSRTTGVGPGIYNGEGSWFSPNGTENISNDLSGNMENNINGGPYTIRLEVDAGTDNYDYYRDDILRASSQNFVNGVSNLNQIRIVTDQYTSGATSFTYDNLRIWLAVDDDPEETLAIEETYSAGSASVETGYNSGNVDMNGNTLLLHLNESSGTIQDSSISGNDGTVVGGVTYGTTGILNDALTFNGSTGYIEMSSELATLRGTSTLMFWINTTQTGSNTPWLAPGVTGIEEGGGTNDVFWGWMNASGQIGFQRGDTAGAMSTTPVNDGEWHHVAITYNASNGSSQVFVDGSLESTVTTLSGTVTNTFTSIGRIEDTGGSPVYLAGTLDEINAWDSVLSPTDIQTIFTRGGLNLQVQIRSCDDAACSGETFIGPDGTAGDYYTEADSTTVGLPDFTITNLSDNQYFQYQVTFSTENGTDNLDLSNMQIDYNTTGAGGGFQTVNLTNTYSNPVVIPFFYLSANTEPISIRLDNITATSFDFMLEDPAGSTLVSDDIHYMVIEEGNWTLPGGLRVEADTIVSSNVSSKGNGWSNYDTVNFTQTFSGDPIVFHAIQTNNDSDWIVSGVTADNSRSNPPDSGGMRIFMNGAEVTSTHGSETIGWVAIEQGTGTIDGVDFEIDQTTDTVRGYGNGCYNFSFANSYPSAPLVLGSMLEIDGGDGGWEVGCNLTASQIGFHAEEDTVGDSERNHTTETFGFAAFESDFAYQGGVDLTFQVRSCNDAACSGETYVGPDGTGGTVFTTPAGQAINVPDNQYFQYRATFTADSTSISSELTSVTIDYTIPGSGGGGGGSGYPTSGTFLSQVFNSDGTATEWDTVYWDEDLPASTDATVAVRVGNTATPDGSWTAWSSEYTDPLGNNIDLTGQYAQYRLTLTSSDDMVTPEVENITLTYNP